MIEDKLDEVRDLDEYYDRVVLGGNVTVRTKIERDTEPTKAEERKATPVYSGVLKYFPNALKEVSKCSLAGQKQHNHGDKLYWDKTKSTDNEDALVRHLIDHSVNPMDDDNVLHLAKCAWRALAALEIYLENER
jgi:hypothetical protein